MEPKYVMRAQFLLEYDRQKTIQNFGGKLAKYMSTYDLQTLGKFICDQLKLSPNRDNLSAGAMFKWHDAIAAGDLDITSAALNSLLLKAEDADPTSNKKFVPTILRWYLSADLECVEDLYKAREPLATYVKLKNKIKDVDLRTISYFDFLRAMRTYAGMQTGSETDKAQEQAFYDSQSASLVHNDAEVKIVIPHTVEASCFFGRNTEWCTAATTSDNMFDDYNKSGTLYIILYKKENRREQWHFDGTDELQFMDENDQPLDYNYIRASKAASILRDTMMDETGYTPRLMKYIAPPLSNEMVEEALSLDSTLIRFVYEHRDEITDLDEAQLQEWTTDALTKSSQVLHDVPQTERNCLTAIQASRSWTPNTINSIKDVNLRYKMALVAAPRDANVLVYCLPNLVEAGIRAAPLELLAVAFHPESIRWCLGYPDEQKMEGHRAMRGLAPKDLLDDIYKKCYNGGGAMRKMVQNTLLDKYNIPPPAADLTKWDRPIGP